MRLKPDLLEATTVALLTRPAHIVLAERDSETRHLVAAALRRDGHEVVVARDREELVEHLGSLCLQHELPDMIIGDALMPGMREVVDSLGEGTWPATPFIVITESGDRSLEEEALRGAVAVFEIPVDMEDLRTTVRSLLDGGEP